MNTTEKLLDMKEQIEDAEKEKGHLEGKISALKDGLKNNYDCANIDEAKDKLKEIEEEQKEDEKKLSDIMDKLESDYEWS